MIYGIIAVAVLLHSIGKPKTEQINLERTTCLDDVLDYHYKMLDELEIEIQIIKDDMRIKDDISYLRNKVGAKQITYLESEIKRHKLEISEITD
jgi:hypothetical protein